MSVPAAGTGGSEVNKPAEAQKPADPAPVKDLSADLAAARAESAKYQTEAKKTAGELAALTAKVSSPDFAKELFGKFLGAEKPVDPVAELVKSRDETAAEKKNAEHYKKIAASNRKAVVAASILNGLPEFEPAAMSKAAKDFADNVELDDDLNPKLDTAGLKAKATEWLNDAEGGAWYKKAAPVQSQTGKTLTPFSVVPAPTKPAENKGAPPPSVNGAPPPLEINSDNFLSTMGLGDKAAPLKTVRAAVGR